jgi:hypothetical protein
VAPEFSEEERQLLELAQQVSGEAPIAGPGAVPHATLEDLTREAAAKPAPVARDFASERADIRRRLLATLP